MIFPELKSIKTRRQKLGIKQKELASMSGVSQSLIAKLEKGRIEVSYSLAGKIFNALDSAEHKNERKCHEIMTKKIISVKETDKVEKAAELMKKNSISQMPVLCAGCKDKVMGSVSDSLILNILTSGISKNKLMKQQIKEMMAEPFPIVNSAMPSSLAIPMLKNTNAILISENSKLIGIITKANLI